MSPIDDITNSLQAAVIEADSSNDTDGYSTEGAASSTQSLTSSILEHVYENGRRYHAKSADNIFFPSDETEQDRLDLMHHASAMVLKGELHTAKFDTPPQRVLDCGTGTGIWALDFGDMYPQAEVIGVDLMPIQPSLTYPNVTFQIDDLEKDWTFRPDYFDYIHTRHIGSSIRDWRRLISQAYTHLAPGGLLEVGEHSLGKLLSDDASIPDTCALQRYFVLVSECLPKVGIRSDMKGEDYIKIMEEVGFVDVQVQEFKMPWGPWPKNKKMKHLGAIIAEVCKTGHEAYGLALFTRVLGWSDEKCKELFKESYEDLFNPKIHAYNLQYQVVGRKPKA